MNLSKIFNLQPDVYHVTGLAHNLDNIETSVYSESLYKPTKNISFTADDINLENYYPEVLDQVFKHYFGRNCNSIGERYIAAHLLELEDTESLEHYIFYPTARMNQDLYNDFIKAVKSIQKFKPNLTVYIFSYLPTDCENLNIDSL